MIYNKIDDVQAFLKSQKIKNKSIGFVPTMGALHQGHISLVEAAKKNNDIVVVSIFVNPIQFNNPDDLKKYPRTLEEDSIMLKEAHCDLIFYPTVEEMYPEEAIKTYNFGELEKVMEGAFRPGHFNGVAVVVKKLFDIIGANNAYFGKKDFQQLAVIRKLVELEKIPINIIACPTEREADGLAMSSRNRRLTPKERPQAAEIFKALTYVKNQRAQYSPQELEKKALEFLAKDFKAEYFQIVDGYSLQNISSWDDTNYPVACVAAHLGSVRLIDNLELL